MDGRLEQRQNVIPVDNETKHSSQRVTADGRTLTYHMNVLQQPMRARACGQGAKSSADRRPVDPPPIVELQIFEGEGSEKHDITFNMNANYFLFASLEQARHMAHGRMSQERNSPPVLTGTPVAGMVYLDRPKPAGYFIFPDLSVRHEGKYRLSFSLFEEVKQAKDSDKTSDGVEPDPSADPCVIHRLEVKSAPFHVYSAKKFPGLTESTALSRTVAEQGCRVRIRRDVRMRRREPKNGSKEWDDYEDETAAQRARASATPDPNAYGSIHTPHASMDPISRPRSASNASHHSLGSITRRPSLQEMGSAYAAQSHYGTAPHTPQSSYSQGPPYAAAQQQQQQYPPAPYAQQPAMQPPPPQFSSQSYPPAVPATQPNYYNYPPAPVPPPQSQASYNVSHPFDSAPQVSRPSVDYASSASSDYRRSSMQLAPPPPPAPSQQQTQHSYSAQVPPPLHTYQQTPASASSYQSIDLYNRPPPLEPRPSAAGTSAARLPPLQTAIASNDKLEASSPVSATPTNSYYNMQQDTHKRSFGNVFSDRYQAGPLRQGARPSIYSATNNMSHNFAAADNMSAAADDDDSTSGELDPKTLGMAYRRADGRQIMRALPGHS